MRPDVNNPNELRPGELKLWKYLINLDNNVESCSVDFTVSITGMDTVYQESFEASREDKFKILDKPCELRIQTQHDNMEVAGQPFYLKILALKKERQDFEYEGPHEITFQTTEDSVGRRPPSYPKKEIVEFSKGYGETSSSFEIFEITEKMIIRAEEARKAQGESEEITIKPSNLQGFKIKFQLSGEEEKNYKILPLDKFDNVIKKNLTIDHDIKPGMILSGSSGCFYEVNELIGHGAMGKVYKAKRLNDNLIVAIKTTLFSALSDINRFLMEGLMLIRFNHPNIVKGYDLRQLVLLDRMRTQSKFFMVMEYLPGQNAKSLMEHSETGVLSYEFATKIILHIARALLYMWDNQTLHRDIKPENIHITDEQKIKLVDLGIARLESGEVDIYVTQKDTIVGSYPYLAPERLKKGPDDYRLDIYSLGATYYHMLTGTPPYLDLYEGSGGKDLLDFLIKIRTRKMPTPIEKLIDIPHEISELVTSMIQIKLNKRLKSPTQLLQSLEHIYHRINPNG